MSCATQPEANFASRRSADSPLQPTNHLDLRAVLWLEEYLTRWVPDPP